MSTQSILSSLDKDNPEPIDFIPLLAELDRKINDFIKANIFLGAPFANPSLSINGMSLSFAIQSHFHQAGFFGSSIHGSNTAKRIGERFTQLNDLKEDMIPDHNFSKAKAQLEELKVMADELECLYTLVESRTDSKGYYKLIEEEVENLTRPGHLLPISYLHKDFRPFFLITGALENLVKAVSNYGLYCLALNGELALSRSISLTSMGRFGLRGGIGFGSEKHNVAGFADSAERQLAALKSIYEGTVRLANRRHAISNYLEARPSLRARL